MKSFEEILKCGVEGYATRDVLDNLDIDQILQSVEEYAQQFATALFRPFPEELPKPGTDVIAVFDYRKWGRGLKALQATVHISESYVDYGGPSSVIGKGKIPPATIYFSIPAIIPPEIVTHWMMMPKLPNQ